MSLSKRQGNGQKSFLDLLAWMEWVLLEVQSGVCLDHHSFFILDISEPSLKGVLQGKEMGWVLSQTNMNLSSFGALTVHLCSGLEGMWHTGEICH